MSFFNRINVVFVLKGQIDTLRAPTDPRADRLETGMFFGIPVLVACALMWSHLHLRAEIVGIIVAGASIFAGLLLNLLVLIVTIAINKTSAGDRTQQEERLSGKLLMETCFNVGFCLLTCIALISTSFLALALTPATNSTPTDIPSQLVRAMVFYLCGLMVLSTLQIIKRVFVLVEYSVKQS
jgi:hypothetical protein